MNRFILIFVSLLLFSTIHAQSKIQFRSSDKAECVKSDNNSLKAVFSFSTLEAQDYQSERGSFSWISLPNTVIGGNEGEPQIPVVNELIAVPFGAKPRIEVTHYSSTDYAMADYGIHTLVPRQPSLRKDKRPEDVPFIYNESTYQTRGLRSEPKAYVSVEGTMRGVRLGKMTIEPVSYDPVNNTLRVFNDIEVEVYFDGADAKATEEMLVSTYSPYFDIVYKQLFNERAVLDIYTQHPDLYTTPVKMLVVTTSTYANSNAFQNWLTWKKQKGISVDVQTVANGASASTIKNTIYSRYNATHPSFLVIVGDETVVTHYSLWDYDSSYGNAATDNEYASVDGDVYHDMYMSRMPVSSTTELNNLVNKILTYEKYTMSDPSYLNKTLLIAGWDSYWTPKIGKPTIEYANNNYFNSAHGITPYVYITTASGQTTCYSNINNVGFINYTAHGDIQEWHDPNYTNSNVNSLSNNGKYFWAMGNCCLTCNFKNAQNSLISFGEAMVRAANKGAFGYIGSIPESYWFEDLYFGVGAFAAVQGTNNPTVSGTSKGCYDAMFDDTGFNTLNSVPFIGNLAVSYAHSKNYSSSVSDEYYWRAYQCFGDGSVMPYLKVPAANNVSHASILPLGVTSFTVSADAKSYVSITVNNEIIGVAQVPTSGTVNVPITAQTTPGTALIVVTRNQRQPYIQEVELVGEQHTITAVASPQAGGTVTGGGEYYKGMECTLTASANHGYEFESWKNGNTVVCEEPTYTFTVSTDATFTAMFNKLTEHQISCPVVEHGTVSISPTTAFKGDLITLSVTLEEGYCFSEWNVTTNDKETIPVVNNQFVMPDKDVTVNAVILKGFNITVTPSEHGTASVNPIYALEGDLVTVSVNPEPNYALQALIVYKTDDINTLVPINGNSFTMPAYDVTVTALFNESQEGEDILIGSGNTTVNGMYLPTSDYNYYSTTQQIYTAGEIGVAGNIAAISFYYKNATTSQPRSLEIYMSHTANSTISSWITCQTSDLVYAGTFTFTQGWNTITLDAPFAYNGSSNLLLTVDDNTGVWGANSAFYTYSTGANRAIYLRDDTHNQTPTNPNMSSEYAGKPSTSNSQIKITMAVSSPTASIIVSPEQLSDFTYVEGNGPSETQSFNIVASIPEDLSINAPEDYEISLSQNGPFVSSLTFPKERLGNTMVASTIYVRLKSDLRAGSYDGETISIVCGETTQTVTVNGEIIQGLYWNVDESSFAMNMNIYAVVQIEGVEQRSDQLEVGGFCGEVCRGSAKLSYCPPYDRYILQLLIFGDDDDEIGFKLYDHESEMESTLTTATTLSFNGEGYGSLYNPVVLNFASAPTTQTQTFMLSQGWNWWSTYIEIDESNGLEALEQKLGSAASTIKSNNSYISYNPDNGWTGELTAFTNEFCYMLLLENDITIELTGQLVDPMEHPVPISPGWNWISYLCQQPMGIEQALSGFTPSENDVIKSPNGYSTFKNGSWSGGVTTFEPGKGYMYFSNDSETKTLTFPSNK